MISVIIPAYNEEKTVAHVIESALKSPLAGEIIVIDDASSDKTYICAREAGARVIRLKTNSGKGAALDRGVRESCYDTLLFLDGDLKGVTPELIQNIGMPVLNRECIMCIAIRDLPFRNFPPVLSGTRALKKSLWEAIPESYKEGYKVEVALNYSGCKLGEVRFVAVTNLHHIIKEKKYGLMRGVKKRAKMIGDLMTISLTLYITPQLYRVRDSIKLFWSRKHRMTKLRNVISELL